MNVAPWRSQISGALHRNRSLVYARYLQLATVRSDGRPANRTVVFRGFYDPFNQLQFVTDRRSEKIDQIVNCSWAEACWYFPKTREQFRLLGELKIIDIENNNSELSQLRQTLWQKLSDSGRSQFYWPSPAAAKAETKAFDPPPQSEDPPETFCVLLLQPQQVDHLELRGTPQNRHHYSFDPQQGWLTKSINP
ncbi:MAG: Npun_F5749 family FMN-dependent PPOX-type flavoprotein [Microcoleaceae cyanobacterium]